MPSLNNFFTDKDSLKTIDTFRVIYFVIFLCSFFLTEFGRNVYRPFIYGNRINDFGLADSIGNLGGIIVQIFFGATILNPSRNKGIRLIIFFSVGYIAYEIVQPYLPRGVFDWQDINGTIIGGVVGLIILLLIHAFVRKNRVFHRFGAR